MLRYLIFISLMLFYSNNSFAQYTLDLITDAVQTYQAGNTDEAVKLLNQAISITPNNIDAKLILGQIFLETNNPKKAENILTKALEINKDNQAINYALGVANFNLQKFNSAIIKLKKVLKLNPKHKTASELLSLCYLNIGVMQYQNNKKENSIKKFKQAIKVDNKNIQAYRNLAVSLYEINKKEEAKKIIKKALKIEPKEKMLLKILIQIYADKNKLEEALEPAKEYYKYYPKDVEGALQLAYLYRFNNQGDKAFVIYEKAIKHSPNEMKIYDDYAELYKYRGKYDEAVNIYNQALNHFSEQSIIFEKIAEIYIDAERYDDARAAYRNALATSVYGSSIYIKIAKTFLTEENKIMSIQIFEEGLKGSPNDWTLLSELGNVLEDTLSTLAINNYKSMANLRPDNPHSYIRLASIYNKIDSNKLAMENCQKAIDVGTEQPLPYHILAELQSGKLDTINSQMNEILSVSKSLKITSSLKSEYTEELKRNGGKLDFTKIEKMKTDSEVMELTQNILKQGLGNLLKLCKPEKFESEIIEWRKTYSQNPYLIEYLGKSYEKENETDLALSTYKELIRLDPKEKAGHLGMARILEAKNQFSDAILAYRRALTIDTEDDEIYKNLIYLSRATERLNELLDNWKLLEKREPENIILLTHIAKVLKIKKKTNELKRVEEKLKQITAYEDNNKPESNFEMRIK